MSIDELFIKHGSDKSSQYHNYSPVYEKLLEPLQSAPIVLLELGIGGYHFVDRGGGDLKAFSTYLPYALILGIDIYQKTFLNVKDRIETYIADQNDIEFFANLRSKVGDFDIVIDDASHINPITIKSFEIIFPMVKSGGTYVIEDVHTSYWWEIATDGTDFKGGLPDIHDSVSVIEYFKNLIDCSLNREDYNKEFSRYWETKGGGGSINKLQPEIESITFHNKMIVIKKK